MMAALLSQLSVLKQLRSLPVKTVDQSAQFVFLGRSQKALPVVTCRRYASDHRY